MEEMRIRRRLYLRILYWYKVFYILIPIEGYYLMEITIAFLFITGTWIYLFWSCKFEEDIRVILPI